MNLFSIENTIALERSCDEGSHVGQGPAPTAGGCRGRSQDAVRRNRVPPGRGHSDPRARSSSDDPASYRVPPRLPRCDPRRRPRGGSVPSRRTARLEGTGRVSTETISVASSFADTFGRMAENPVDGTFRTWMPREYETADPAVAVRTGSGRGPTSRVSPTGRRGPKPPRRRPVHPDGDPPDVRPGRRAASRPVTPGVRAGNTGTNGDTPPDDHTDSDLGT